MHFNEIPLYTQNAPYQVDVSLDYFEKQIQEYITEYGLQLEPDFQRGHVWTEKQQIAFVEHILRGGQTGHNLYFNHPTWMSAFESGEFVCVDGLQRVTAIRRFMNNEIKAFGYYRNEYEGRMRLHCHMRICINTLKTRKEVLKWYVEMNAGGTPHTEEEIEKVVKMMESEEIA